MESFVIIVNGCKPLTIITKRSILDIASSPRSASANHNTIYFKIDDLDLGPVLVSMSPWVNNNIIINTKTLQFTMLRSSYAAKLFFIDLGTNKPILARHCSI